jgi:hypothetical protein
MTDLIKYSNLNEKISIKINNYCFFIKDNIITPYFTDFKNCDIFIYQGNDNNFINNNLLLNINLNCNNEIIFIKFEFILDNYLKINIFNNSNIFYFNIIKIIKKKYLNNLKLDQIELLKYCNKIKEHIFSKHFIMSNKNKLILIYQINNITYNLNNYNSQKIMDIFLQIKYRFLL